MQIQNNPNVNFKANLITKTTRYYKSGRNPKTEIIEVFKLNNTDRPFAEKCCNILGHYYKRDLKYLQKRMSSFFESFLGDKVFKEKEYYLAIKNGKEIAGGIAALPLGNKIFVVDAFSITPKDYNMDILTYAFLTGTKSEYPVYSIETNNLIDRFKNKKTEVLSSNIRHIKSNIKKLYQGSYFERGKAENTSLDAIFGTSDFELEVNPHLK